MEDARVELKATWSADHHGAARRLAGHANAAGGTTILWLFGVDEAGRSTPGVLAEERSTWWAQVTSYFADGVYPAVQDVVVDQEGTSIVALAFETDRAPYVVTTAGGAVTREVPWREATSVRTAKRNELLLMLSEVVSLPEVEVLGATASAVLREGALNLLEMEVDIRVYFDVVPGSWIVFPFHHARFVVSCEPDSWQDLEVPKIAAKEGTVPSTALATAADLSLQGPGGIALLGWGQIPRPLDEPVGDLHVVGELWPTRSGVPVRIDAIVPFLGDVTPPPAARGTVLRRWAWGPPGP